MTNSKNTKRALLSSVISLILCLSMLVGTTFAWFTDSVASGKNVIEAGNLDIELEYLADGTWTKVTESTNVFKEDTLWEPGHTEVVYLKIANVGTLDLKYQLGIHVFEEITSVNAKGEEIKLSDHLEFGIIEDVKTPYAGREEARKALTASEKLSTGYSPEEGKLYDAKEAAADSTKPSEKYLAMVVYMPETVGNEANYLTGEVAPMINLGINLMATQLMSEEDSFGNDYDKNAIFAGIPSATVTKLSVMPTVPMKNLGNLNAPATGETTLDVAYNFATTQTPEQAAMNKYAKYHADFVVSFSNPVKANTVALGGYYAYWCDSHNDGQWLAFAIPEDVAANTPIRLLDTAGISMNYEELCQYVQNFQCGAADLTGENVGTTMTAELRIYEVAEPDWNTGNSWNVETGVSEVFGVYAYTFENPTDLPQATVAVAPEFVGAELNWNSQYSQVPANTKLESAYTFTANEIDPVSYAKWSADFEVSVDRDITDGQLILAGQYDAFSPDWIGFEAPATAANEKVALLGTAGIHVNYEEICNYIKTFNCGVADVDDALAGATITVELVLTSPDGNQSYVVSTNTYTF